MPPTVTHPPIPGYRIIKPEGQGSVGTVYRARSERTDTLVAIKQISRRLTAQPAFLSVLKEGVKRASGWSHRHIARPLALERAGEHVFLLTEFVEGESLRDVFRERGRIGEEEARGYILQAALGLDYASLRGVLHYDLKPSNILVSDDGGVKVVDFSLNFHTFVTGLPEEQVYELMEFPLYTSPEERKGGALTVSSNIFSLGAIYYHMVYGTPLLNAAGERRNRVGTTEETEVSEQVRQVIDRMTAEYPDERFEGYDELIEALGGRDRPKVSLVDWGLYAGVLAILVLSLGVILRGMRAHPGSDKDAWADLPGEQPRAAEPGLKSPAPEEDFQAAESFFIQHPDQMKEAREKFERITIRYPGTPWAYDAQKHVDEIREKEAEGEQGRWRRLEREMTRLQKQEHFAEAYALLEQFSSSVSGKPEREKLEEMRKKIEDQEKASYGELRGRVEAAVAAGKWETARKELAFAGVYFSDPELKASAKSEQARVERAWSAAVAKDPSTAKAEPSPEELSFRSFVRQAVSALAEFKYSKAERICRPAAQQFEDREFRSYAGVVLEAIPEDQKFVQMLFSRIRQGRLATPAVLRTTDGRKLSISWADWEGVTLSPSGQEKWGWKEFDLSEIYRMLEQCTRPQDPGEQLGMGRFCFLRNLRGPMAQKFQQAIQGNAALQSVVDRWRVSARLRSLLEQGD